LGLQVSIDNRKDFELPQEMIQPGVLADIVDKGQVPNKFKPGTMQHKCYFVWIVAEEDAEGRNKRVFESFTVSLHEKARLRKRVKELLGSDVAAGEEFQLDSLIGTKRMLVLAVEDGQDNKQYVKITATMALKKGQPGVDVPKDFIRKQDQPEKQ
jgi:hypothetical protein